MAPSHEAGGAGYLVLMDRKYMKQIVTVSSQKMVPNKCYQFEFLNKVSTWAGPCSVLCASVPTTHAVCEPQGASEVSQQPAQEEKEARDKPTAALPSSPGGCQRAGPWGRSSLVRAPLAAPAVHVAGRTTHLSSGCGKHDILGRSSLLGDLTGLGTLCSQQATGDMALLGCAIGVYALVCLYGDGCVQKL